MTPLLWFALGMSVGVFVLTLALLAGMTIRQGEEGDARARLKDGRE